MSLEGLPTAAQSILDALTPASGGATLVTLSGELGAGKTALTRAFAHELGVEESVTSPTFVLEKVYLLPQYGTWKRLIHIDAYRLKGGEELAGLGFDEAMKDAGNLIVLEWPEQVAGALPAPSLALTLTPQADGSRLISYA